MPFSSLICLTLHPNHAEYTGSQKFHGFVHANLFAWDSLSLLVHWKVLVLFDAAKLSLLRGAFPDLLN